MGVGSGKGFHDPYHKHHHKHHHKTHHTIQESSERTFQNIHGEPHRFKPPPLINLPGPVYPFKGLRLRIG